MTLRADAVIEQDQGRGPRLPAVAAGPRIVEFVTVLFLASSVYCGGPRSQPSEERPEQRDPALLVRTQPTPNPGEPAPVPADVALYPWLEGRSADALYSRFPPPSGFERVAAEPGSFGRWLRGLPLKPGRPAVQLYNGAPKFNQSAHVAVVDIDVGAGDLQQCADAVMRLRAEYLFNKPGCADAVAFNFTSGFRAGWKEWRDGMRWIVEGNRVRSGRRAVMDGSRENFRRYLSVIFTYAGSASLEQELDKVQDPAGVAVGDVFIQGGFPGHAVIVVDVVEDGGGARMLLLAQSYMPAQDLHILKNPDSTRSPWYPASSAGALSTPEWEFRYEDLRRFHAAPCEQSHGG